MIARKISLAFTFAVMLIVSTAIARAQTSEFENQRAQAASQGGLLDVLEQIRQTQAQAFEGSWAVTVTPVVPPGVPQPPSFRGYGTVSRGGAYFGSDRTRPFSKQHGAWVSLGGHEFAYTFTEDLFDANGIFAGEFKVRVRLTITGNDTFVGVSNAETRNLAGNLVNSRCATVRGDRIKVEPLAPMCQSITPPQ